MDQLATDVDFDTYARSRGQALVRYAFLLCGDRGLAQDLTQEALIKGSARWSRLREGAPDQYLRKVITNDFLSWKRRRSNREIVSHDVVGGPMRDLYGELLARDEMARAMQSLPTRQRAVLVLRYYEERSDEEIASILGCRPGTVRSLATRAFASLRSSPHLSDARPPTPTKANP